MCLNNQIKKCLLFVKVLLYRLPTQTLATVFKYSLFEYPVPKGNIEQLVSKLLSS